MPRPAEHADPRPRIAGAYAAWAAFAPLSHTGILWWVATAKTAGTRVDRVAETARLAALGLCPNHSESRER